MYGSRLYDFAQTRMDNNHTMILKSQNHTFLIRMVLRFMVLENRGWTSPKTGAMKKNRPLCERILNILIITFDSNRLEFCDGFKHY